MWKYFIFALTVAYAWGDPCGQTPIKPDLGGSYIVGGTEAVPHSWPWQISLGTADYHFCGGSILNSNWIITAAHCTEGEVAQELRVRVGYHRMDRLGGTEKTFTVEKIIDHEDYDNMMLDHDVSLLKLTESITFSDAVQPVCLPRSGEQWDEDDMVVTGWGALKFNGRSSNELRQVVVRHIHHEVCAQKNWNGEGINEETMICAGYPHGGKDSCQGDSGGPLVVKQTKGYVLAGIVSWGDRCAKPKAPGVYTHVSAFVDWINDKVANN